MGERELNMDPASPRGYGRTSCTGYTGWGKTGRKQTTDFTDEHRWRLTPTPHWRDREGRKGERLNGNWIHEGHEETRRDTKKIIVIVILIMVLIENSTKDPILISLIGLGFQCYFQISPICDCVPSISVNHFVS